MHCLPSVTHTIILWCPFSNIMVSEILLYLVLTIFSNLSSFFTASLRGMQEEYQKKALSAFQRWFSDCPKCLSLTHTHTHTHTHMLCTLMRFSLSLSQGTESVPHWSPSCFLPGVAAGCVSTGRRINICLHTGSENENISLSDDGFLPGCT